MVNMHGAMVAGRLRGIRHTALMLAPGHGVKCSIWYGTVRYGRNGGKCVSALSTVNNALRVQTSSRAHHQILMIVLIETTYDLVQQ